MARGGLVICTLCMRTQIVWHSPCPPGRLLPPQHAVGARQHAGGGGGVHTNQLMDRAGAEGLAAVPGGDPAAVPAARLQVPAGARTGRGITVSHNVQVQIHSICYKQDANVEIDLKDTLERFIR